MRALAETARWAAAWRERESLRADRLFHDPWASLLAGAEGRRMLELADAANSRQQSVGAHLAVRTRFCDDRAVAAQQVVSVAAGMDARAFRMDWHPGVRSFEFDQAEVMELKLKLLNQQVPRCCWEPFAADVREDWTGPLGNTGFQHAAPTVWILEGILQYLSETEVHTLLARITACSAPGSMLCADLPSASFFRSPWTRPAMEACAVRGVGWQFASDDPEMLVERHGWKAEVRQLGEEGANYGRWTDRVFDRKLTEIPRFFLVCAARPSNL